MHRNNTGLSGCLLHKIIVPHFIRPILEKQSGKTSFTFIRNHYGYQTYYHSRSWRMVKCLLLGKRDFGLYAKGYKVRAVENSLESLEKDTDNTIRLIGAHPDRSFWSDMITAVLSSPEPATKTTSSALFIVRLIPSMKAKPSTMYCPLSRPIAKCHEFRGYTGRLHPDQIRQIQGQLLPGCC